MSEPRKGVNVAIAEALGWQWHGEPDWHRRDPYWKKGDLAYQFLPNYCASLDLMAKAEAALEKYEDLIAFEFWLTEILSKVPAPSNQFLFRATAAQRAEALCRVKKLGPWREKIP